VSSLRLNRRLYRHLGSLLTRRANGRRFRRTDLLAEVCRAVNLCLRQAKKMAKADPHLFGPHARAYRLDVLRMEQEEQLIHAALDKIYGPSPPDAPGPRSIWREHYDIPPEQRKVFFKWFKERYGS
jgi:hypothetical protein